MPKILLVALHVLYQAANNCTEIGSKHQLAPRLGDSSPRQAAVIRVLGLQSRLGAQFLVTFKDHMKYIVERKFSNLLL